MLRYPKKKKKKKEEVCFGENRRGHFCIKLTHYLFYRTARDWSTDPTRTKKNRRRREKCRSTWGHGAWPLAAPPASRSPLDPPRLAAGSEQRAKASCWWMLLRVATKRKTAHLLNAKGSHQRRHLHAVIIGDPSLLYTHNFAWVSFLLKTFLVEEKYLIVVRAPLIQKIFIGILKNWNP